MSTVAADAATTYEVIDRRFKAYVDPIAWLDRHHTGNRWAEGPDRKSAG